jgi:nucleotide-binding universal stress UspA family protein
MFDSVIVGIDGGDGGRDALALASMLREEGGQLTLANVYAQAYVWKGGHPAYQLVKEEDSLAMLERTRREGGVDAQLTQVGEPSVGKGLHELAEDARADLLVVGSSRRGLVGRVMLRDDTRAALNGASCAIAIAPAGYALDPHPMRQIGVGYNGSTESNHALRVARELSKTHDAKLSALEVVSVPTYAVLGTMTSASADDLVELARKRIATLEAAALERIATLGGVEPRAAYGQPAEELAQYSASLDLLVVGSRDYGPLGRLIHGSATRRLARSARCPLLVLTRAARRAESSAPSGDSPEAVRVVRDS